MQERERLALAASMLRVRGLLADGRDADAADAAKAAAATQAGASHPLPPALSLLTQLAAGRGGDAAAAAAQQLAGSAVGGSSSGGGGDGGGAPDVLRAAAAKIAGDALLLVSPGEQEQEQAAAAAYTAAADAAAAAAAAAAQAGADAGPLSRRFAAEVEADAALGLAHVAARRREWDAAEEALGRALKAAEAAAGDAAPLLAPVLCALGHVYARSARVMYAEGVLREAGKLARLDPSRLSVAPPARDLGAGLHAALAWRHAQLLTALPNRGGEAAAWEGAARAMWARCPTLRGDGALEAALGDLPALTGKGQHGGGWVASLLPRRLLVAAAAGGPA